MNEIGLSEKGRGGKEGGIDGRLDDKWKKGNSSLRRKKRGGGRKRRRTERRTEWRGRESQANRQPGFMDSYSCWAEKHTRLGCSFSDRVS